jgi:DNA-binding GntR family transcriptional regulator
LRERFSPLPLTLTLPLQIADRIAQSIVEEKFVPGERLKEVELAGAFLVSRATIREALRILEKRGMVSILPQHGAHVSKLSRQELENMFDIRIVLLGLASRTLAHRTTPEVERQLREGLKRLEAAREDANEYARASAAMTLLIVDLAGNAQLTEHIKSFAQHIGRYARLGFVTAARRDQSLRSWKKLLRAVLAGEERNAETLHRALSEENRNAALAELDRRTKDEEAAAPQRARRRATEQTAKERLAVRPGMPKQSA